MSVPGELLTFFGQEMVAHAATFVATLAAAFLFMSSLQWRSYVGRIVHFLVSWSLLFAATYVLFRMLWYGQLVYAVTTNTTCGQTTLAEYYICVTNLTLQTMRQGAPWTWLSFIAQFQGSYNNPVGLVCALIVGFCIAFVISLLLVARTSKQPPTQ